MEIEDSSVRDWLSDIDDAKKRDKTFLKAGEKINKIYNGDDPELVPFNILYSNTETLVPALYSQTPRPVVKRRWNQEVSPLVEAVEKSGTRILEYFLDTNMEGYERFDESMVDGVKDSALPGRGVTQVKFDAIMEGEGEGETLKYPTICTESRKWNRVYFGYALKWSKVPWIAFEEYLQRDECIDLFGLEKTHKIEFIEQKEDEGDKETSKTGESTGRKTALIYQIWCKTTKKVKYISPQYDGYLDEINDPLEITGFFPIPKPLSLIRKSNDMSVTALYTIYENQAKELNRITVRLNRIIEAIKVRGVVDGALSDDLERSLAEEGDGVFVPTEKGASLVEGGFDKAIWMMPIEKLVTTARELFGAREECKRVIYEITGLSDIIRGSSKASETLGAQKIKETWGTMRLKNMQRDVQKYVRDTLRIMLDVASMKIPMRFWSNFTGLSYPTNEEREQAQAQIQQIQAQAQEVARQAQIMAQQTRQPPQPQQPPQIDPKLQEVAKSPTWEEILEVLKDDLTRSYRIDIETNSTLDVEATEDQAQVGDFMNAMGQFMNGMMPMVQQQILPFGAAKSMLLEIARRFRFGVDVENEIKQMQEPKGGDPEQAQKQLQEQAKKMEQQQKQAQSEIQKSQQQLEQAQEQFEAEQKRAGDNLDSQFAKLEQDKMEFNYEKQLFIKEQQFNQQLASKEIQMEKKEAETEISNRLADSERKLQSMLDKHSCAIEKTITIAEAKNDQRTVSGGQE